MDIFVRKAYNPYRFNFPKGVLDEFNLADEKDLFFILLRLENSQSALITPVVYQEQNTSKAKKDLQKNTALHEKIINDFLAQFNRQTNVLISPYSEKTKNDAPESLLYAKFISYIINDLTEQISIINEMAKVTNNDDLNIIADIINAFTDKLKKQKAYKKAIEQLENDE